jgi:hypothetical protein
VCVCMCVNVCVMEGVRKREEETSARRGVCACVCVIVVRACVYVCDGRSEGRNVSEIRKVRACMCLFYARRKSEK